MTLIVIIFTFYFLSYVAPKSLVPFLANRSSPADSSDRLFGVNDCPKSRRSLIAVRRDGRRRGAEFLVGSNTMPRGIRLYSSTWFTLPHERGQVYVLLNKCKSEGTRKCSPLSAVYGHSRSAGRPAPQIVFPPPTTITISDNRIR